MAHRVFLVAGVALSTHQQSADSPLSPGINATRLEIELFIIGLLLSVIPLPVIIGAATSFERHQAFELLKLRYEFAYAGICALILVLFQHYRHAHRYVIGFSALCVGFSFYVAGALLMYNNEPRFYKVEDIILDKNIAKYVKAASTLSWPLFIISFGLGLALILARRSSAVSRVKIIEDDQ